GAAGRARSTYRRRWARGAGGRPSLFFFVFGPHPRVALAGFGGKTRRIGVRRVRQKKVVGPREDVVDAGPARAHQQGRRHTAARRHAAEDEGLLDVIAVALPRGDARGLLRGIIEEPAHALGVERGGATRGGGRAEGAG